MKIWRVVANSNHGVDNNNSNKNDGVVDDSDVLVSLLKGEKATARDVRKAEQLLNREAAAAAAQQEDTRNDAPVVERKDPATKKQKKKKKQNKKSHKITVERNKNNNDAPRELPAIESHAISPTLSRLLFSNTQYMEERGQMKVVYRQFGPDAEDVLIVEHEDGMPPPKDDDHVVVKVQASTVTLEDCLMRRGFDFNLLNPVCLPQTPGFDIVGHVCACGSNVGQAFKEGDRVAALVRTGGNARFTSVPAKSLVKIPKSIDSAEAAAMVSTFTTAYQTLKRITQKGPMFSLLGKRVLILGGMDAVGQALIQMCTKARAEIYAPCPHSCHLYVLNVLGAHPLPEDKDQWLPLVEGQIDYVFDGICEDGLETSYKALNEEGELVCFGHTAMLKERHMGILGAPISAHVNKLWSQTKTRAKTIDIWESFQADPETYKKNVKSLCQLLKWNKIKPNIARHVGLSEVAEAQTKLESGEIRGTVVCLPWKHVEGKN